MLCGDINGTTVEGIAEVESCWQHAVICIDHMNNHAAYMKTLRKWSEGYGLAGKLLYRMRARVENVYVILYGPPDAIGSFITRLRTEYVDIDSRGIKCKERQSTVMCQRDVTEHKAGEEPAKEIEGWEIVEYKDDAQLQKYLQDLNLLHVGSGSTRYACKNKC